jgi:Nicotianamine synthase protein
MDVHDFLMRQSDLSPCNPQINAKLSGLVEATMKPRGAGEVQAILNTAHIQEIAPSLRRLLGKAEYEMERFSAAAFTGDQPGITDKRYASFDHFIYMKNYDALVESEMKAMGWPKKQPPLDDKTESVAFVGAGPLPISAILLHLRTGHPVTCIDSDEEACKLGSKLIRHLSASNPKYKSLADNMHYAHAPGDKHDYVTHPIVFVASLVEPKDPVVMRILTTSDTTSTLIVRSAEGLSSLLYEPHKCRGGLEEYNLYFSAQTAPNAEAINTSLVFKIPSGKARMRHKIGFERPTDIYTLNQRPQPMWRTNAQKLSI